MASRRRRVRWWLKWAGVAACLLVVVMWGASAFYLVDVYWGHFWLVSRYGDVGLIRMPDYSREDHMMDLGRDPDSYVIIHKADPPALNWGAPGWERSASEGAWSALETGYWAVFLLFAVPTAYLWWRDRRRPRGHCAECGYDLTGNVSGVCPECGERV
jgi:hypothetical protein